MSAPPVVVFTSEPEGMLEIARFVVVAAVPVAFRKVKFWRVEDAEARRDANDAVPVSVGLLERTKFPVPVSSESQDASWFEFEKSVEVAIAV